jgi:hypothetical protein
MKKKNLTMDLQITISRVFSCVADLLAKASARAFVLFPDLFLSRYDLRGTCLLSTTLGIAVRIFFVQGRSRGGTTYSQVDLFIGAFQGSENGH